MRGYLQKLPLPLLIKIGVIIGACIILVTAGTILLVHRSPRHSTEQKLSNVSVAAPTGLSVTPIDTTHIKLSWHASADAKSYSVYRNGIKIATVTSTSYTDYNLLAKTVYSYYVVANPTRGGAASAPSKVVSARTLGTSQTASGSTTTSGKTGSTGPATGSSGQPSGTSGNTSSSGSGSNIPSGISLQQIDGGQNYFSKWSNGFPSSSDFLPIGVYPSEVVPASLAGENINFFTPMRDEQAGTWCPVWSNPNGNDMTGVYATAGFYAGGSFYQANGPAWGSRAAFNVFGDELDGNASNWFDCLPTNITSNNQAGSWGGLSASAFESAEAASHTDDPSRPTYIQTTVTFMDGGANYFYTTADKQVICSGTDIFSFDIYPLVLRGGNVWDMYDQVKEARGYCQDSRPVMAFTEMDHMNGGTIYPLPAQTTAEVWNAIIAGARGVEYFDQYANIANSSYTGGGHYSAGAMYTAIKTTNAQIVSLAPVINAPFATNYVSVTGSMSIMAKYYNSHFYIFAIPHASGSQTVNFALTGTPNTTVSVLNENRSISVINGSFSDTFANENTVHIYEVN